MAEQRIRNLGATQVKRIEQYKDRWTSFGANTGILEISEKPTAEILKRYDIFGEYDDKFLERLSPDISIARWKQGTILFEEGSYIDVAFFVVEGSVDMSLRAQQQASASGRPIFDAGRTVFMPGFDAPRDSGDTFAKAAPARKANAPKGKAGTAQRATNIAFLSVMDFNLPTGGVLRLGAGELFGEIGALSGWPQSVTARTATECVLVQIRVAALRTMRRKSKALKERLDRLYRERSLFSQLKATPLLATCSDDAVKALTGSVELVSCEPGEIIARQGDTVDAMYMVRSGFVALSQQLGEGSIVVSYLSKGMTLGESELLLGDGQTWMCTAASTQYSELVKFTREDVLGLLKRYPAMETALWNASVDRIRETGSSRKTIAQSEFIDTALDRGLVEGSSILVIDLERCTRCDDCVKGCADTHGGIPRFVREGDKYKNFLLTRACYHCEDPVCLVGCPTGAIRRAAVGDVVAITDDLCIGCGSCATNCPYDAITMHDTGTQWAQDAIPEGLRGIQRLLATKCDLCYASATGPACVNSCPHDCAVRIGSIDEFKKLLTKE